jgi:hypothetical protein
LKNLSEILKSNVTATNEKSSDDLKQFYEKTLPFISKFLYAETDMFDESYNKRKLKEIFSQMKFFTVDNIEVTYEYKTISFDHVYHCYLDQKFKKFYLLKTLHYSQSIDTMIQFIINDTIKECQYKRDKLDKYYRKLLAAYSKGQLEQSTMDNNDETKPKCEINGKNKEIDENKVEEEDINNDDTTPDISTNPTLAAEIYNEKEVIIPKSKLQQKQTNPQFNMNRFNSDINIHDKTNKLTTDDNVKNNDQSTVTVGKEYQRPGSFFSSFIMYIAKKHYDR